MVIVASQKRNLFWDSCCFIAFLNDASVPYDVASLEQYLDEARNGKVVIYSSTIALAEVRGSLIKKKHSALLLTS
jgi:hypothetical protein